ncbi:MAG: hypothetical protein M3Y87_22950, partial [Myxococcota bacterium]|nr:hypothetical protein [Myxococcota bacterium]
IAAAIATSIASAAALAAVGFTIHRLFGAFLRPLSALRAVSAGACGWLAAHFVPHATAVGAVIACVTGAIAYLAALVVLREIDGADLALVKRVITRRR